MGASTEDVNLIIISQGKTQYWSGMKGCGNVILDIRFGLYSEVCEPDISWINKSVWKEMLLPLDEPLECPIYGDLIVDFDKRVITERTGFGSPTQIMNQWLSITWEDPRDAPISRKTLVEHLKNQRVSVTLRGKGSETVVLSKKLNETIQELEALAEKECAFLVDFALPEGWKLDLDE